MKLSNRRKGDAKVPLCSSRNRTINTSNTNHTNHTNHTINGLYRKAEKQLYELYQLYMELRGSKYEKILY